MTGQSLACTAHDWNSKQIVKFLDKSSTDGLKNDRSREPLTGWSGGIKQFYQFFLPFNPCSLPLDSQPIDQPVAESKVAHGVAR
jgi:hypothetical protein